MLPSSGSASRWLAHVASHDWAGEALLGRSSTALRADCISRSSASGDLALETGVLQRCHRRVGQRRQQPSSHHRPAW
jgi:hypothetical protein